MIEKIRVKLDEGARIDPPTHEGDAGYDIYSREKGMVPTLGGSCEFHTGVHIEIPRGYVGFLKSKSGLNVKNSITGEGVIDSGYTGEIVVKLYNFGKHYHWINPGDKLIQLVILPIITPPLELVDEIESGTRGERGFGSTDAPSAESCFSCGRKG